MIDQSDEIESEALQPRRRQVKVPQSLPTDFIKNIAKLFNDQFKKEKGGASFSIYGGLYNDEALLCISLAEAGKLLAASLYFSADLGKSVAVKPEQVTNLLKSMVDLAASWFAQSFTGRETTGLEAILEALEDLERGWQKVKWEKRDIYVKVNRANQTLEAAADRILRESKN